MVADAVRRDLEALGWDTLPGLESLVETLVVLAGELDRPGNSATSRSMCARAFLEGWDRLRALAPADDEGDRLDELAGRRAVRLAGIAAS